MASEVGQRLMNQHSADPSVISDVAITTTQIQPMPLESRQRIVAGQAVSDLASCVKELIDNALDARSKSINSKYFSPKYSSNWLSTF
jgi:hypothetical protein